MQCLKSDPKIEFVLETIIRSFITNVTNDLFFVESFGIISVLFYAFEL